MKKHILYISTTLPTLGFGSSVIIYRHLKRLKDWKVSLISFPQELKEVHGIPKEWQIINIKEKKRWWPPLRYGVPALTHIRVTLLFKECESHFKKNRPNVVLNHFGKNSLLAYALSKKWNVPLCLILHDRYEAWAKKEIDKHMTKDMAMKILNHASRIWSVSRELAEFYKIRDSEKINILPPIPQGNSKGFPIWRDDFLKSPVVGFAGSFHSHQLIHFRNIANIFESWGGKIIIVSKKNNEIKESLKDITNIEYFEPFEKNEEVINFLLRNASCILIPDSIDPRAAGSSLSFPSRLVEFSQLGLPMIIISQEGTALSNWAKSHKWIGYLECPDMHSLEDKLRMVASKEGWKNMAAQSRNIALTEFNPDSIQEKFEGGLMVA